MPPRKEKIPPPESSVKPLPKSREALAVLLRAVEKVLDFLEPTLHGEVMRLAELQRVFAEPQRLLQQQPFLTAIAAANQLRFAQGGPSASALIPYVNSAEMNALQEKHQVARAKMVPPAGANAQVIQSWKPAVKELEELLIAQQAQINLFCDLQQRVIAALNATGEADADEVDITDINTDKNHLFRVRLPENPDVLRLAKMINDRGVEELSQNDIALQFTKGNKEKAQNLLRQLRRFPHLISKHK